MGRGFLTASKERRLFDFAFLVHDMLANHWVIFFHFQLVGRGSLVFVRGVEMACASGRIHSDLFSHRYSPLYLFAASSNVGQDLFYAVLVNNPHTLARDAQGHEAFLRRQPKTMLMQIG